MLKRLLVKREAYSIPPHPYSTLCPGWAPMLCYAILCPDILCWQVQVNQWVADNELMVSKHADKLEHVDTGRKISSDPKTWVCEDSGKTENLWLNLSTGMVW